MIERLKLLVRGLENRLILDVDQPAGLETVEDLPRILAQPEQGREAGGVGQPIAVLLGETLPFFANDIWIGEVATCFRVGVVFDGVDGRRVAPWDRFTAREELACVDQGGERDGIEVARG